MTDRILGRRIAVKARYFRKRVDPVEGGAFPYLTTRGELSALSNNAQTYPEHWGAFDHCTGVDWRTAIAAKRRLAFVSTLLGSLDIGFRLPAKYEFVRRNVHVGSKYPAGEGLTVYAMAHSEYC